MAVITEVIDYIMTAEVVYVVVSVYDWEAFTVGNDHYLLSAEYTSADSDPSATTSTTYTSDAGTAGRRMRTGGVIYRWQGVEKFVAVHWIDTAAAGVTDWETFSTHSGDVYLVCANGLAGVSQVFKVKMV